MTDSIYVRRDRWQQIESYLRTQAQKGDRNAQKLLLGLEIDKVQRQHLSNLGCQFDGLLSEMGIERITAH